MLIIDTDQAIEDIRKHFWGLRKAEVQAATVRTLNDTIKSAQVTARRLITRGYNIKPSYVRTGLLPIEKASKNHMGATLSLYNKPLSLGVFKGATQTDEGVLVSIQKRKKVTIKGAFILADTPNAVFGRTEHEGNPYRGGRFVRRNKRKQPAKKVAKGKYTPDLPIGSYRTLSLAAQGRNPIVFDKLSERIADTIVKRGVYQFQRILNK